MSLAAEKHVADQIRKKKLELKALRRQEVQDADEIIVKQNEMDTLLEKYNTVADGKTYTEQNDDIAHDFCEEYFYELCKQTRDEVSVGRFYELDAVLIIVGKDKFVGKLDVVNSIAAKFRDLTLVQTMDSVAVDLSLTKGGIINFECKSRLQINNDTPRKILQMFEIVRSTLPTTNPYVIRKEYFIVQDARPLYHWPEKPITVTNHDNWEPQFKPKVVERPKSATVAVVEVAPEVVAAVDKDSDEEGGSDEGEEDGGDVEGGEQEKGGDGDAGEEEVEDADNAQLEDENAIDDDNFIGELGVETAEMASEAGDDGTPALGSPRNQHIIAETAIDVEDQ